LLQQGIYSQIATPLKGGRLRAVGLHLMAEQVGRFQADPADLKRRRMSRGVTVGRSGRTSSIVVRLSALRSASGFTSPPTPRATTVTAELAPEDPQALADGNGLSNDSIALELRQGAATSS